jgi:hypothetical protein
MLGFLQTPNAALQRRVRLEDAIILITLIMFQNRNRCIDGVFLVSFFIHTFEFDI